MTNQSASEPMKQGKGASSNPVSLTCLSHATQQKKAARSVEVVRSVEADVSYLCSAFLAERGCLSPDKSHRHNTA